MKCFAGIYDFFFYDPVTSYLPRDEPTSRKFIIEMIFEELRLILFALYFSIDTRDHFLKLPGNLSNFNASKETLINRFNIFTTKLPESQNWDALPILHFLMNISRN